MIDYDSKEDKINSINIIDFGFSVFDQENQRSNKLCGTPNYMAPEMFDESNFDLFKADVWAMGVVFYKVFSGNYPFKHQR